MGGWGRRRRGGIGLKKTSLSCYNAQFFFTFWFCLHVKCFVYIFKSSQKLRTVCTINSLDPNGKAVFSVVWLIWCFPPANSLFLLLCLCLHSPPPSCLTGCHHIFSQLPTTSYSATTDLNTDLASSVPLRRERERYPQPPPAMLQGENFACLISLPATRVHLVISSRFLHILPFSWSAARLENTVLVSKNVSSTFILPIYLFPYFQRVLGEEGHWTLWGRHLFGVSRAFR